MGDQKIKESQIKEVLVALSEKQPAITPFVSASIIEAFIRPHIASVFDGYDMKLTDALSKEQFEYELKQHFSKLRRRTSEAKSMKKMIFYWIYTCNMCELILLSKRYKVKAYASSEADI